MRIDASQHLWEDSCNSKQHLIGHDIVGSRLNLLVKTLTQETIEDNARFFAADEYQPSLSLTMGIGTIMDARCVLLIATGESKADAMQATVEGPVSAMCPASILQMHANAIVVMDEAAAAKLANAEFYRFVETQRIQLAARSAA